MLIDEYIEILINNKNITKYRNLGYIVKSMQKCKIKVSDLSIGSMSKVRAKCENCSSINIVTYNNYASKQLPKHGFYVCKKCHKIKSKITCLQNYGVENYFSTDECKDKVSQTFLERYGVTNYTKTDEYKIKCKETSLKTYGVEHPTQSDVVKNKRYETNLERYGHKSPDFGRDLDKVKETNIERYGVIYPMQNIEVFNKYIKNCFNIKYIYNLYYQSSYELHFIEYCASKNIIIENCDITFNYILENKKRKYYPDFYLPEYNIIIEIKSQYFYIKDLDKNIEKEKSVIGYNFLFIIDKDYTKINELIHKKHYIQ